MLAVRSFIGSAFNFGVKGRCMIQISPNCRPASKSANLEGEMKLPEKPKKPSTPFIDYYTKMYAEMTKDGPKSITGLSKLASEKWKTVDPATKAQLYEKYATQFKTYTQNFELYKKSLTPEQEEYLLAEKKRITKEKELKKIKMESKLSGRPKRPINGFQLFIKEKLAGKPPSPELIKALGQEWTSLDETTKNDYKSKTNDLFKKFREDLLKWEHEMITQGKQELVRKKSLLDSQSTEMKPRKQKDVSKMMPKVVPSVGKKAKPISAA